MYTPLNKASQPSFSNKVLILPTVSKGNAPQLAADLLITSLGIQKIGYLDSSCLVPVVGANEGGAKGLSTPLEVFSSNESKVVVVQQRSPVIKAYKEDFVDSLLGWISTSKFEAVIVIAGMDTTDRSDSQMHTPSYHYLPPKSPALPKALSESLQIVSAYTPPPPPLYLRETRPPPDPAAVPVIPGGGLTRRILTSISPEKRKDWNVPVVALLQFVFEGDNRGDAGLLVAIVNKLLDLNLKELREPGSWKQGLYGTNHDDSLFG